eukprot:TRINITY_DN221_c0_g1_i3.p1 TRINITY_DN221_c0_g1~~TRINITY_DN221_c0_g1_i3.p1  ORF type:complete len:831 (-),score=149.88 TRINITY_DN221_c0_g1_i3:133-2625(-)
MESVIRIKPFFYIHVLDNNSNVTRTEIGPKTFTRQEHEKVVFGPEPMVVVPPRHYCIIANPVMKDKDGKIMMDKFGQVQLRHGDEEIRFSCEPFCLYYGEQLYGKVTPLQTVPHDTALRLAAIRDFTEECTDTAKDGKQVTKQVKRAAGDEWLFPGPSTYIPKVEVQVREVVKAIVILPGEALRLRAKKETTSKLDGIKRQAGEEWLVKRVGAYLPSVEEEVVGVVKPLVITNKTALHLRATKTFTDEFKTVRKAGEEWLVTLEMADSHIPDVYEEVLGERQITVLGNREYCVVLDPVDKNGVPQLGRCELRKGECTFFLKPGERLENNTVQKVYILQNEEALLLNAIEQFEDHAPGDRWMVVGPCEYIPPVSVEVVQRRKAIPLDDNEGIYVRDIKTGKVRVERGKSYMLKANEELWEKELPQIVEELLSRDVRVAKSASSDGQPRDKTRLVTLRLPHNSACQVYDFKDKKSRVVFGPELVSLEPDEQFTVLDLSGGKPKEPHKIKALALLLGPDFMTDVIVVDTADHARLQLKLSYNYAFEVNKESPDSVKIFHHPDFVGDSCKTIAARVRSAVAAISFDYFHRNSAKIIRESVFGSSKDGKLRFEANNLVISGVDIQSVEPVDAKTRESLQKSVQLAIEITTRSQEANATHEAERLDQEAQGKLEIQRLANESEAEKSRKELLALQAESSAVESAGQAKAEAKARAEASQIEGEAAVKQAELKAQASQLRAKVELEQLKIRQEHEIQHKKSLNELEMEKLKQLSEIEANKFQEMVSSIGANTIAAIARAGPEMQAKLLSGLGLKSVMITDGSSPINLFNTASGLIKQ